ncbi:glycosyltransferase family 4 protein [Candidatus Woesearchaeota archaeon]|nr:glycosyltransferase family 4 protein [Candidatus Woesearchaeota archaeon]
MRLNILKIGWFYSPIVGGAETVMRLFAEELVKKGNSVTVLCSGREENIINKVRVIRSKYINRKNDDLKLFMNWFGRFLDENGFDIVHCHNLSLNFNVEKSLAILQACRYRAIPIIEHSHNAQLRYRRRTTKIINFDFDRVICVSNFVYKRLCTLRQKKDCVKLYNPIDFTFLDRAVKRNVLAHTKNNCCIIFFPARAIGLHHGMPVFQKQKQLFTLLMACKILKSKRLNFSLVIPGVIGQPGISNKIARIGASLVKKTITRFKLQDCVTLLPRIIPLEEMPNYYAASDIICMPGINETFGLAIAEGLAAGKPVVASKSGGALEIVKDGETGFLVEPKDVESLAHKLEVLIMNKDIRTKFGIAGKERMKKLFSKEYVIPRLIKVYNSVFFSNIIPILVRRLHYKLQRLFIQRKQV